MLVWVNDVFYFRNIRVIVIVIGSVVSVFYYIRVILVNSWVVFFNGNLFGGSWVSYVLEILMLGYMFVRVRGLCFGGFLYGGDIIIYVCIWKFFIL